MYGRFNKRIDFIIRSVSDLRWLYVLGLVTGLMLPDPLQAQSLTRDTFTCATGHSYLAYVKVSKSGVDTPPEEEIFHIERASEHCPEDLPLLYDLYMIKKGYSSEGGFKCGDFLAFKLAIMMEAGGDSSFNFWNGYDVFDIPDLRHFVSTVENCPLAIDVWNRHIADRIERLLLERQEIDEMRRVYFFVVGYTGVTNTPDVLTRVAEVAYRLVTKDGKVPPSKELLRMTLRDGSFERQYERELEHAKDFKDYKFASETISEEIQATLVELRDKYY